MRASVEYRVFQDSLEVQTGIVARRIENIQFFRVRDIALAQSVLGRLLGYGSAAVTSTDHSKPQLTLRGVTAPREVYDTLRELIARSQATRRTMIVETEEGAGEGSAGR